MLAGPQELAEEQEGLTVEKEEEVRYALMEAVTWEQLEPG